MIKCKRLTWSGQVARIEEEREASKILTGKRLLGRPRRRWKDNIRMDLKEIGMNSLSVFQPTDRVFDSRYFNYFKNGLGLEKGPMSTLRNRIMKGCPFLSFTIHCSLTEMQLYVRSAYNVSLTTVNHCISH